MNDVANPTGLDFEHYAIGQPAPRTEDPVFAVIGAQRPCCTARCRRLILAASR